jgi:FkbM family methyltransferase
MNSFTFTYEGKEYKIAHSIKDRSSVVHLLYRESFEFLSYTDEKCKIEPGDTVLDCGANIGTFALFALLKGAGKVIAIEPNRIITYFLQKNITDNGFADRFELIEAALWDRVLPVEEGLIFSPRWTSCSSHIAEAQVQTRNTLTVPAITIDSLKLKKLDFIKTDLEGSEMPALRGAVETIKRCRPKLALSLYHKPEDLKEIPEFVESLDMGYNLDIVVAMLGNRGFKYYIGHWS